MVIITELAKNQVHTVKIESYNSEGAGVCRIFGRAVFVDNAIPGETWEILILKAGSTAVYGKGIKLLEASPERIDPACSLFGKCGGCDLMHMSYNEEKRFKLSRVNEAIARIAGLNFTIDEIIGAEDYGTHRYRNKAVYAVGRGKDGKAVTGFYRERSHDIVPAQDCLIQTKLSVKAARALCEFMDLSGISAYDESRGTGCIRHLYTRCSFKFPQSLACLVTVNGLGEHEGALVEHMRKRCPELSGIVLCVNKSRGNTVLKGDFYTLWGSEIIEDELCSLKFKISPASFYQVNPPQAEKLYERVRQYAIFENAGTVLDLYCGTGTISLCLARHADFVYGAEVNEAAVLNARQNAIDNGIKNVEFILGDAYEAARRLEAKGGGNLDAIVVDPPRKGLAPELIDTIVKMSPKRVVYVSCNPGTLARDLRHFAAARWFPKAGTAFDMFPRCAHVECVVALGL